MAEDKITEGQFMNAIEKMVKQCYLALDSIPSELDEVDMPEGKKNQYKEIYIEFSEALKKLDDFQNGYDGPRDEEKEEEEGTEEEKRPSYKTILGRVDGIIREYEFCEYMLKYDIKDRIIKGIDLRRYKQLLKKYELLVNEWKDWKNEYELKNNELEQKKTKIAEFFEASEDGFVKFYNEYLSYYGEAEDKIYDTLEKETQKYIDDFFSKYTALEVLRAFPLDGSYKTTDRWCLVGITMKSSNNPLDLVENREEFLEDVARKYLEYKLPGDLRFKLEEGLEEEPKESMPSDKPLPIAEIGPAVLPGDIGPFCVDSKTLEPKDEDLEEMEFFELDGDNPVGHKN